MELLKKAFFENVDTVVATKSEVAYLKESVLLFSSGKKIKFTSNQIRSFSG